MENKEEDKEGDKKMTMKEKMDSMAVSVYKG